MIALDETLEDHQTCHNSICSWWSWDQTHQDWPCGNHESVWRRTDCPETTANMLTMDRKASDPGHMRFWISLSSLCIFLSDWQPCEPTQTRLKRDAKCGEENSPESQRLQGALPSSSSQNLLHHHHHQPGQTGSPRPDTLSQRVLSDYVSVRGASGDTDKV